MGTCPNAHAGLRVLARLSPPWAIAFETGGEPQSVCLHSVLVVFVQWRKTPFPCNASQIVQGAQAHGEFDWLSNVFWGHVRHRVFVPARHESLMGICLLLALHTEQAEHI